MRVNVVSISPTVCNMRVAKINIIAENINSSVEFVNMRVQVNNIDVDILNTRVDILNVLVVISCMSVLMINMTVLSCNRHCNMIAACFYKYIKASLDNQSHDTIIRVLQDRSSRRQEALTLSV